jgi:hypothetical protein
MIEQDFEEKCILNPLDGHGLIMSSKAISHFWRLNLLQIQTSIVHVVALDELYKTAYLDFYNKYQISH